MVSRGPPKGYTEALERRLEETEVALLQIVLASDQTTWGQAFANDSLESAQSYWESHRSRFIEERDNKKSESIKTSFVSYWEQSSLGTPDGVRSWAEGIMGRPLSSHHPLSQSLDPNNNNNGSRPPQSRGESSRSEPPSMKSHQIELPPGIMPLQQIALHSATRSSETNRSSSSLLQDLDRPKSDTGQKVNLSESFQRQFLW